MVDKPKSMAVIASDLSNLPELVRLDDYKKVLNSPPPIEFVERHPQNDKLLYIPIDKVELMLDKIFQIWHVDILDTKIVANAIAVTVRVNYRNPITNEMEHQDGVGAVALQVDKGSNPTDFSKIKSNAVMLGLPSAKSYAIKDACDHIGKIFGRDLNRKDTVAFMPSYATDENIDLVEAKKAEILKEAQNESN